MARSPEGPKKLSVEWIKCEGDKKNEDVWCSLLKLDLKSVDREGVYIIWHGGKNPRVVDVGQGIIVDRLRTHRYDEKITKYSKRGTLYVTWAAVPKSHRNGVERYLADKCSPLVGKRYPQVDPIEVNSPWS